MDIDKVFLEILFYITSSLRTETKDPSITIYTKDGRLLSYENYSQGQFYFIDEDTGNKFIFSTEYLLFNEIAYIEGSYTYLHEKYGIQRKHGIIYGNIDDIPKVD